MIFMFIKMSSGWYAKEVQSVSEALNAHNAMDHIRQGEIVAFADDVETFAYEMDIQEEDITLT